MRQKNEIRKSKGNDRRPIKCYSEKKGFIIFVVIWSVARKIKPIRRKGLLRLRSTQKTIKGLPTRSEKYFKLTSVSSCWRFVIHFTCQVSEW